MTLVREIRRRAVHVVGPILGLLVLSYFVYHSFQGERGLLAWVQLGQEIEQAQALRDQTAAERAHLESLVSLLQREHIDADLLDERARLLIGLGRRDELVIYTQPRAATPAR